MDPGSDFWTIFLGGLSAQDRARFLLFGARLAGLFITVPFFSSGIVPLKVRLGLAALLLALLSAVPPLFSALGTGALGLTGAKPAISAVPPLAEGVMASLLDPARGPVLLALEILVGICLGW